MSTVVSCNYNAITIIAKHILNLMLLGFFFVFFLLFAEQHLSTDDNHDNKYSDAEPWPQTTLLAALINECGFI